MDRATTNPPVRSCLADEYEHRTTVRYDVPEVYLLYFRAKDCQSFGGLILTRFGHRTQINTDSHRCHGSIYTRVHFRPISQ